MAFLYEKATLTTAGLGSESGERKAAQAVFALPCSKRFPLRRIASIVLVVAIAVATLFFWRKSTPPLVARLLPESQAIVYLNLSPLRAATHFDRKPVAHDPDYQRFIDATGIDAERDLDQAAIALTRLPDLSGPNGGLAFSEVFAGHFDPARLTRYLNTIASATDSYAGRTIYAIPSQGRTVRVAVLPHGLIAVSNTPTPEQLHSILDRARTAWLPFGSAGPTLLSEHYRDLPVLSLAWGLGEIGLPFAEHGELRLLGLTLPFRMDETFVASLRWTGALRFRLEEIAPNEQAARASAGALSGLLSLGRIAENTLPDKVTGADLRTLLDSASVTHYADRAVLNATLPEGLLRSLAGTNGPLSPRTGK